MNTDTEVEHALVVKSARLTMHADSEGESQSPQDVRMKEEGDRGMAEDEVGSSKGAVSKTKATKICLVCGDRALGYNFGVITCESCKAYFRRNASKGSIKGRCDGACKITVESRSFCKHCRLKKCFEVGMKKEMISSEHKSSKKPVVTTENERVAARQSPNSFTKELMTPEDAQSLENMIKAFELAFDGPCEQPVKTNPVSQVEFINMADAQVRRLIKMAKHIPEFLEVTQAEQIALLKGCVVEVLAIKSCITYNMDNDSWTLKSKEDTSKEAAVSEMVVHKPEFQGSFAENFEKYKQFAKSLEGTIRKDKKILILIISLCLFASDRPGVENTDLISKIQQKYARTLQRYLNTNYPDETTLFPKAMGKVTSIRDIGLAQAQIMLNMNASEIEPLLVEIFNL